MTATSAALKSIREELRYIAKVPVYFAQASTTGEIKIGFSTQVANRLYLLGHHRFQTVNLLGWIPGGPKVEREMHARFDEFALGREWFAPAPELLSFIATSTNRGEPVNMASKYGRITDMGYDALVRYEHRIAHPNIS